MNSVPTDGGFSPSAVVLPWMDKIVRHVSNPGTIRFPANAAAERYGFNHGFKVVRCLDFASTHSCGPTAVDPQPWTHSRQNKGWLCEPPLLYWCPHGHSLSVSNKRSRGHLPHSFQAPFFLRNHPKPCRNSRFFEKNDGGTRRGNEPTPGKAAPRPQRFLAHLGIGRRVPVD